MREKIQHSEMQAKKGEKEKCKRMEGESTLKWRRKHVIMYKSPHDDVRTNGSTKLENSKKITNNYEIADLISSLLFFLSYL